MRATVAVLAILAAMPATAATFTTERLADGRVALHMHGIIQRGDEVLFTDAMRRTPAPVLLLLDSPGGNMWSSLELGRRNTVPTEVQAGERCASGCAMVWASGPERYIEPGGRVGFHRASMTVRGREVEVPSANDLTRAYYARLGFGQDAVRVMMEAPPESMHWVDDFDTMSGITFAPREPTRGRPFMTVKAGSVPDAVPTPAGDPVLLAWIAGGDRAAMPAASTVAQAAPASVPFSPPKPVVIFDVRPDGTMLQHPRRALVKAPPPPPKVIERPVALVTTAAPIE